ncbi:YceI family protein, partial [Staphylococcus aureus]
MRRILLATAATALFATAAFAMDFTPPSTDLAKAHTGKYVMDASHANVIFNLSHLGYSHYFGRFNKLEGTLVFDNKA